MNQEIETHPPLGRRLDSWKEVAAYLGRDVRTVQRWEKMDRLPVHRVPGGRSRSVFAFSSELDAWMAAGPRPHARRRWTVWAAAAAGIAAVAFGALGRAALRGPVSTVVVQSGNLVGLDTAQRELWRTAIPEASSAAVSSAGVLLGDVNGDAKRDALVRIHVGGDHGTETSDVLYCLSEAGKFRWKQRFDDRLMFRSGEYSAPWVTRDLLVIERGRSKRIAVAAHHGIWWPGILTIFDGDGRVLHRFVNSGWITQLEVTRDGKYLLAAGVNNARDSAMLAVIDVDSPSGTSPEDAGSPFECLNCPAGRPARYFVLPRSELSRLVGGPLLKQTVDILPDGVIVLRVPQDPNSATEAVYEFSPDLDLRRASLSDGYWDWHRRLEAQHTLAHADRSCPERGGLAVTSWEPARGWRTWTAPLSANAQPPRVD
jgi:hypothetical protein